MNHISHVDGHTLGSACLEQFLSTLNSILIYLLQPVLNHVCLLPFK